ncbi:MAG TPA: sigma 54-interacting transcriptional regulator [Kofleriaceae bacterium]|nr:sigma 54-interacting transcriptional regulator [Kofleriaceae bacterium]
MSGPIINATTEDRPVAFDRTGAPTYTLWLVYSGDDVLAPPEVHTPRRGATPIGRQVDGGIALPRDRRASRLHATLHAGPTGRLRVIDEQSRNGTHVNGRRVTDALLSDGDVLAIGVSYFVIRAVPAGLRDAVVPSMVGVSPLIRVVRAALAQAAPTGATVLLLAESGCGKEVAARALHELSGREGPFVAVNCSAIPESLAESQLFGHVAGAFTGAAARPGLFRAANGGTLFLDEVGDLPPAIQPKLLRVLEDRAVLSVGATATVPVDFRVVAATNRDLSSAITERQFRGDLYARLAQLEVRLPLLRDRREDVLLLLRHALDDSALRLTPALADALLLYNWPFNVREVFAIAQQLRVHREGGGPLDLPLVAGRLSATAPSAISPRESEKDEEADDDLDAVPDRAGLETLLRAHRGVVSDVARAVHRSRKQVYRWIASHGLDVRRYRGDDS